MSAPMEMDEPATEEVPLDLTTEKEQNCAASEAEAQLDGPGKLTEDAAPVSLDLSTGRPLPLRSPPSPQLQCHLDSPSPTMAAEQLAPLHGMYADAAAYWHTISSAAVPEHNPFPPVLPTSADTRFHHHNHIQHQLQHMYMQQQYQLNLQLQLQLQAAYGGIPMDPTSMVPVSPVYATTSSPSLSETNHYPSGGFDGSLSMPAHGFGYPYYDWTLDACVTGGAYGGVDTSGIRSDRPSPESTTSCTTTTDDHYNQPHQQRDLDRRYHHRINAPRAMGGVQGVVDPEEVAAVHRQSDFLRFRQRYMDSLGPPSNFEKTRWSRINSSSSNNNDGDDQGLTPGQQQYDQTYAVKRQKKNEAAKRLRDAKQRTYVENQIIVMYLTKKVSEMKDIKRRLLKDNSDMLAE